MKMERKKRFLMILMIDLTYESEYEDGNDEKKGLYATRSKSDRNEAGFDSIYQLETI